MEAKTYVNHRQQNVASSGGFLGPIRRVDQRVDGGAREDQSAGEEANDGNVVSLCRVGRNDDEDANNAAEHECYREP